MAEKKMPVRGEHAGVRFHTVDNTIIFSLDKEDVYLGVHHTGQFPSEDALRAAVESMREVYRAQKGKPAVFRQNAGKSADSGIEGLIEQISGRPLGASILHTILYTEMSGDESLGDVKTSIYPSGHILIERRRLSAEGDPLCRFTLARDFYAADERLIAEALGKKK